jgi:hypothetical protein
VNSLPFRLNSLQLANAFLLVSIFFALKVGTRYIPVLGSYLVWWVRTVSRNLVLFLELLLELESIVFLKNQIPVPFRCVTRSGTRTDRLNPGLNRHI